MIVRKTIAFNVIDPDQEAMLKHADLRPNFSGYIKRLIQRDMEGGRPQGGILEIERAPEIQELVEGLI